MPSIVKKHHQRTIDKMHMIVRLELANPSLSSTAIAELCGLTLWKSSVLRATPAFKQIHNAYMTGIFTALDNRVSNQIGLAQETMNMAVPVAMQKLVHQMMQDKNMAIQNKAANDILDRHGHFVKVSRLHATVDGDRAMAEDRDNRAVAEMVKHLAGVGGGVNNQPSPDPPANIFDAPITKQVQ